MLTHVCGNTCDPVSILYLPVFFKLQVLLTEKNSRRFTCCVRFLVGKTQHISHMLCVGVA